MQHGRLLHRGAGTDGKLGRHGTISVKKRGDKHEQEIIDRRFRRGRFASGERYARAVEESGCIPITLRDADAEQETARRRTRARRGNDEMSLPVAADRSDVE